MRLTILNVTSFNLFPQNINPNSIIFHPNHIFSHKPEYDRVRVYVFGENVETNDIWNGEYYK